MPNRVIKEGICTNEQIDALSPFEETFFYRLIVNADDYGRMDGRIAVLKSRLYPLKSIRDDQIEKALHSLATVELVHRYNVHGKPFVSLLGWERNQSIRAKKSKYPAPEDSDECIDSQSLESTCMQMHADECKCSRNPIQSESNPNPEAEYAHATAAAVECTPIEAYAASNLDFLSPRNMEELVEFVADLSDELVKYAIDESCASGKRTWGYVRAILRRYLAAGYKSLGEVKAAETKREQQKQPEQRPVEPKVRWSL